MASLSKRTIFTSITPLPDDISRDTVITFLQDHERMIDLNPLVTSRSPIPPPAHASSEEQTCTWYTITDRIEYIAGISGDIHYTCAFHNLPRGLQTHCFAAMGVDIRDKWSVGGSMPGEQPEPMELGLNAPNKGLYLREDVDLRCNVLMAGFVKKTLKKAHASLVVELTKWAKSQGKMDDMLGIPQTNSSTSPTSSFETSSQKASNYQTSSNQWQPGHAHANSTGSQYGTSQYQGYGREELNEDARPYVSSGAGQGQPWQVQSQGSSQRPSHTPYDVSGSNQVQMAELDGGQDYPSRR